MMLKRNLLKAWDYVRASTVWLAAGAAVGVICGLVGGLFAMAVEWATHMRGEWSFVGVIEHGYTKSVFLDQ